MTRPVDLATELLGVAVGHLSAGYGELVDSFATADDDLRTLLREHGAAAVLDSDHPLLASRRKENRELVTRAEQVAEAAMRDLIGATFPGDAIVGEELGATPGGERLWVLDPVDGTSAMIRTALAQALGVPLPQPAPAFGVSIAVVQGDAAVVGVVGQLRPYGEGLALAHTWVGEQGRATTRDGEPVRPPAPPSIDGATLACTVPEVMFSDPAAWAGFAALRGATRTFVPDQNCIGFVALLDGTVHIVAERDLTLPDAAALIPLLTGGGVTVTDHRGGPVRFDAGFRDGEYALLAAPPALHGAALAALHSGASGNHRGSDQPYNGYVKKFRSIDG